MTKAPGIWLSSVAKTAPLALARSARCPSVVCFGVRTHLGSREMSRSSGMKVQRIPLLLFQLEQKLARLCHRRAVLLSLSKHAHKAQFGDGTRCQFRNASRRRGVPPSWRPADGTHAPIRRARAEHSRPVGISRKIGKRFAHLRARQLGQPLDRRLKPAVQ